MATLRDVLQFPLAYRAFGSLIGAHGGRLRLVRDYIRPKIGDRILDIGCGPAEIVAYLPDVRYLGFDSNERYIANAKRRWSARGDFEVGTVNQALLGNRHFEIALAIGVVHHLDDDEASRLFRLAYDALAPGGRLITLDGLYVANQAPLIRWMLANDRGKFVRQLGEYETLARSAFAHITSVVLHDFMKPLPYTHLIMQCEKPGG